MAFGSQSFRIDFFQDIEYSVVECKAVYFQWNQNGIPTESWLAIPDETTENVQDCRDQTRTPICDFVTSNDSDFLTDRIYNYDCQEWSYMDFSNFTTRGSNQIPFAQCNSYDSELLWGLNPDRWYPLGECRKENENDPFSIGTFYSRILPAIVPTLSNTTEELEVLIMERLSRDGACATEFDLRITQNLECVASNSDPLDEGRFINHMRAIGPSSELDLHWFGKDGFGCHIRNGLFKNSELPPDFGSIEAIAALSVNPETPTTKECIAGGGSPNCHIPYVDEDGFYFEPTYYQLPQARGYCDCIQFFEYNYDITQGYTCYGDPSLASASGYLRNLGQCMSGDLLDTLDGMNRGSIRGFSGVRVNMNGPIPDLVFLERSGIMFWYDYQSPYCGYEEPSYPNVVAPYVCYGEIQATDTIYIIMSQCNDICGLDGFGCGPEVSNLASFITPAVLQCPTAQACIAGCQGTSEIIGFQGISCAELSWGGYSIVSGGCSCDFLSASKLEEFPELKRISELGLNFFTLSLWEQQLIKNNSISQDSKVIDIFNDDQTINPNKLPQHVKDMNERMDNTSAKKILNLLPNSISKTYPNYGPTTGFTLNYILQHRFPKKEKREVFLQSDIGCTLGIALVSSQQGIIPTIQLIEGQPIVQPSETLIYGEVYETTPGIWDSATNNPFIYNSEDDFNWKGLMLNDGQGIYLLAILQCGDFLNVTVPYSGTFNWQ